MGGAVSTRFGSRSNMSSEGRVGWWYTALQVVSKLGASDINIPGLYWFSLKLVFCISTHEGENLDGWTGCRRNDRKKFGNHWYRPLRDKSSIKGGKSIFISIYKAVFHQRGVTKARHADTHLWIHIYNFLSVPRPPESRNYHYHQLESTSGQR